MENPLSPIKFAPIGGIDSDSDPDYINNGNYRLWTSNVEHLTQDGLTTYAITPILGNDFAYDLGSVTTQNKKFRITFTNDKARQWRYEIFDGNNVSINKILTPLQNYTAVGTTITVKPLGTLISQAQTYFTSELTIAGLSFVISSGTVNSNTGFVDIEITGRGGLIPFWDWNIKVIEDSQVQVVNGVVTITPAESVGTKVIVTQESIDTSLEGQQLHIGSSDVNGDLIIWSTAQTELPQNLTVLSAVNAGGRIRLTVSDPSAVKDFSLVIVTGTGAANGRWIVRKVTVGTTVFIELLGSVFAPITTFGTMIINSLGVGEIGVGLKDGNSSTWNYTPLLRSKEWNFRTKKQIKGVCTKDNVQLSCYFTDDYNQPRVFYYAGAYIANGALNYINPKGQYAYGSIFNEVILIPGTSTFKLSFTAQEQTGGNVKVGNHRYTIRLLTDALVPTPWSDFSGRIPVYAPSTTANPQDIYGSIQTDVTAKINKLLISGIIPDLFKWVELADIYYFDKNTPPLTTLIRRDLLTGSVTQPIEHNGNETNTQLVDFGEFAATTAGVDVRTALNIDIINNHLVLSNLTTNDALNFAPWTSTFKHSLKFETIVGRGSRVLSTLTNEEYLKPSNVCDKMGHMINETKRIGCKLRLTSGFISDSFWIDDIRIDDYLQGGVPFNRGNPSDNRRISSLPNLNITNGDATEVYVPIIEINGIDWDYPVNGVPVKNYVDEIIFEQAVMDDNNREVLGSGVVVMGIDCPHQSVPLFANRSMSGHGIEMVDQRVSGTGFGLQDEFGMLFPSTAAINRLDGQPAFDSQDRNDLTDFFFAGGVSFQRWPVQRLPYDGVAVNVQGANYERSGLFTGYNLQRNYASFYSPDYILDRNSYLFRLGDVLVSLGAPQELYPSVKIGARAGMNNQEAWDNNMREFTGFTNVGYRNFSVANIEHTIDDGINVARGAVGQFGVNGGNRYYSHNPFMYWIDGQDQGNDPPTFSQDWNFFMDMPSSPVVHTSTPIQKLSSFSDFGVYMAQMYRPLNDKFGNKENTKYETLNSSCVTGELSCDVYGDVFTQKVWLKHVRTGNLYARDANGHLTWKLSGFNKGLAYYCQGYVNFAMQKLSVNTYSTQYPNNDQTEWLNVNGVSATATNSNLFTETSPLITIYDHGYNSRNNGIVTSSAFDVNLPHPDDMPTRIIYSKVKPQDALRDYFRDFPILNFKDLDLAYGEIIHHCNVNGELFTVQNRHYMLQYFETTGLLTSSTVDVVLGNGGIMTQKGTALSSWGSKHGFSVVTGRTAGGKDAVYWINTENGKVMRHRPSDGTVCLSDEFNMRWFFNNYLRFADFEITPADGRGICGVWDEQKANVIWTIRAMKKMADWAQGTYGLNAEVIYGTTGFTQIPQVYVSLVAGNTSLPTDDTKWRKVELTDYDYYNFFTIVFNERKNKFTTFFSFLPKIYLKHGKEFLSPRPVGAQSKAYEHYRGEIGVFYKDGTDEQADGWSVRGMTINIDPDSGKRFTALEMLTSHVPERMEMYNDKYATFLVDTDFEPRWDYFVSTVKNNVVNGRNDLDEDSIFGSYLAHDLYGSPRRPQKLVNMISRVLFKTRSYKT